MQTGEVRRKRRRAATLWGALQFAQSLSASELRLFLMICEVRALGGSAPLTTEDLVAALRREGKVTTPDAAKMLKSALFHKIAGNQDGAFQLYIYAAAKRRQPVLWRYKRCNVCSSVVYIDPPPSKSVRSRTATQPGSIVCPIHPDTGTHVSRDKKTVVNLGVSVREDRFEQAFPLDKLRPKRTRKPATEPRLSSE